MSGSRRAPLPLAMSLAIALGLADCKSQSREEERPGMRAQAQAGTQAPPVPAGRPGQYGAFQGIFTRVASMVVPAVVSISSERIVSTPQNPFDFFQGEPFEFFFGEPGRRPPGQRPGGPGQRRQSGLGSGVVAGTDGYILTNNHVVEGAQKLTVQLSDEREFEAEVVGTDPPTDLAVIRIKGDSPDLAALPFGDSDKLQIGEWVVAVGAPFGLYETVTAGIISAMGRQNTGISTYGNFLQTDAAINPGNSGGPLVNLNGEVIGINTAIYSQSGGYQGIGFAIPVNLAKNVMEKLIKSGKVTRGWLGISIQAITPEMADALGLKERKGALIGDVVHGGPAEKAGLRRGDIVLSLAGKEVRDANDLMNRVALFPPGATVDLVLLRGGKRSNVKVRVGTREEEKVSRSSLGGNDGIPPPAAAGLAALGIEVAGLDDRLRRQFRIGRSGREGVVVVRMDPTGSAAEAGLKEGDVIVEANRNPLAAASDFRNILLKSGGKGILLLIDRKGATFFAVLTLPSP